MLYEFDNPVPERDGSLCAVLYRCVVLFRSIAMKEKRLFIYFVSG